MTTKNIFGKPEKQHLREKDEKKNFRNLEKNLKMLKRQLWKQNKII